MNLVFVSPFTNIGPTKSLWILKCAILDFFKRLTSTSWKRSYDLTLLTIRCILGVTFVGVIISDFVECRPFNNYYQVLPDPGGQCRQGYVQLITMASCNVLTDLLLVLFPVPIILRSHMPVKKKVQLVLLFSLSLGVVGVTLYRVPHIIWQDGSQQIRSLLASVELLFATAAANALVLGSFVRDRGVKKARYRHGSITGESIDGSAWSQRRPTIHRNWGSDEDLVRDLGFGADRELRSKNRGGSDDEPRFTPAPLAKLSHDMNNWRFPRGQRSPGEQSEDSLLPLQATRSNNTNTTNTPTPRRVSFFDVGGLLGDDQSYSTRDRDRDSFQSNVDPLSPHSLLATQNYHKPRNTSHDLPTPTIPAGASGLRRGSQALIQDLGGLWSPFSTKSPRSRGSPTGTELSTIPQHTRQPSWDTPDYRGGPILSDPGGLLR
jgi:hypothetical protein